MSRFLGFAALLCVVLVSGCEDVGPNGSSQAGKDSISGATSEETNADDQVVSSSSEGVISDPDHYFNAQRAVSKPVKGDIENVTEEAVVLRDELKALYERGNRLLKEHERAGRTEGPTSPYVYMKDKYASGIYFSQYKIETSVSDLYVTTESLKRSKREFESLLDTIELDLAERGKLAKETYEATMQSHK